MERLGFRLDVDHHPSDVFRVVQMTPHGSACRHMTPEGRAPGPHPRRGDDESFADFADPDGNTGVLQDVGHGAGSG